MFRRLSRTDETYVVAALRVHYYQQPILMRVAYQNQPVFISGMKRVIDRQ